MREKFFLNVLKTSMLSLPNPACSCIENFQNSTSYRLCSVYNTQIHENNIPISIGNAVGTSRRR